VKLAAVQKMGSYVLDELEWSLVWLPPCCRRLPTATAPRTLAGLFFGSLALVSANAINTSAAVMNSPAQYAHFIVGSGCVAKKRTKKIGPTMPKTNIISWMRT